MLDEVRAALAAAKKYKPSSELERAHVEFVRALLTDAVTRVEMLPNIVTTAKMADAVEQAENALEAARAAQRG